MLFVQDPCAEMCVGHCSRCVGTALIPIAVVCMVANVLLLFPDMKSQYLTESHVTREAMWGSGIWASGLLVGLHYTSRQAFLVLYWLYRRSDTV